MAIKQTECPFCGNPVYADDRWAGIELDCPFCQQVFTMPAEKLTCSVVDDQLLYTMPPEKSEPPQMADDEPQIAYIEPATLFTAFKKCVQFRGRSSRREFWLFMILYFVIQLLATVLLGRYVSANITFVAVSLVFLLPFLAVSVRRFHDLGLSGWCCLMTLIPFIGGFVQLIFMSFPSQLPDNKYGRNPNGFHPDKAWPVIAGWLAAVFAGAIL